MNTRYVTQFENVNFGLTLLILRPFLADSDSEHSE